MTIKSTILSCIAALSCFCAFAQETMRLQGTVYDELGEALPGAVVTVKASASDTKPKASSVADIDGHYAIPCRPGDIIEVHFLGYEVPVLTVGKSSTLNFNLEPARSRQLDEAVVIGYGSVKAADITGSITNVKMADLRDAPVTNIDAALQGRIAGADIMSTTGEPGATTSIRIRGTRSITAGNEPLIVVDGVMDAISDLNDLNPDDVESISVLKDASSTAIYGSRGSNGVILVTTKAGTVSQTSGKPYITRKLEAGVSTLPRKLDIMNAKEFANFRNEYQVGQSASLDWNVPVSELVASDPASYGKGTDWIGEITRPAPYQNYFLSVSGGKGPTKYYASFGYTDERGIIRASGQNRFSGNFSASHRILKWLEAGYKTNFNRRKIDATLASVGGTAYYNAAMYLSPLIGPHDNFNPLYGSGQRINTPVSLIEQNQNYALQTSSTQTAWADATLLKDLKWRTQVSWWTLARETYRYYPSTLPKKTEGEGGEAYRATSPQGSLNAESTVSYKKDWQKKYHLDAMAGLTWYQSHFENFGLSGSGYLNDEVTWNNMGAVTDKNTYKASSSYSFKKKLSVVGRVNFNINKKFYFTLSGRADGASNFAASRKWGFFPSAAFKWNINDALALKLSAGRTGNDAISAYMSMSAMYASNDGYLFGGTQPAAYYISRLDSPDLTWETTDLYNAALTGSYFNNRLNFTAEVYYSRTTDLLLQVNTAAATGYASRWANLGCTSNKGVELSIDTRNIVKRNFTWSTSFTISHNAQMVEDIGNEEYQSVYNSPGNNSFMMYGYVKGYPLNSLWGFKYAGVWHNEAEKEANKYTHAYISSTTNQQLGNPKFIDVNHDGLLNMDDLVYLGNADPDFYGGIQNNFTLGGFNLGVYFTYSVGGAIYNYSEFYMAGSRNTNQYRYMLDAWSPTNPDSDYPRAGFLECHVPSSLLVHDASFFRLQTLSLGYTFKLRKTWAKDLTLTGTGSNLFLIKNYNGFDPDVSSEGTSSTLRRADIGAYPKARRFVFSIRVRY